MSGEEAHRSAAPPEAGGSRRRRAPLRALAALAALALGASGCAAGRKPVEACPPAPPGADAAIYRRADAARSRLLEREIERLNADVRAAEEALVAVESGLRGAQTRTEAVSMLAEARIQVNRAAQRATWRADAAAEARAKLDEADSQLAQGHVGSAIFFASRASRMAATLQAEADRVARTPTKRFVRAGRVNLRAEPNTESEVVGVLSGDLPVFPEADEGDWVLVHTVAGQVGWVHASLLRAR
jgi:hypothetical protein